MKTKINSDILKKTGALLQGHFLLSSGLHSDQYVQCALVLQHPQYAAELGEAIAERFEKDGITVVAGPALGGVIIAHEVAAALGVKCIFGERENGIMKLRRGFSVDKNDKALIVEDVITTGGSLKELAGVLSQAGAEIAGVASIIDRRAQPVEFGVRTECLVRLEFETYKPEECPLCKAGSAPVKPGSRK